MTLVSLPTAVPSSSPTAPSPGARRARAGRALLPFAAPLLTVLVLATFARPVDPDAVTGLGLVSVIPVPVLVMAAVLSVSFAAVLSGAEKDPETSRKTVLLAHLGALLVVLHGVGPLLQEEPRFTTAWLHAGFVDALREHGRPVPGLDARFSWPGFFAASAAFVEAAGLPSAVPLLRFAPLFFNLAYLPPLALIARACVPSTAGRWIVMWLFLLTNWVGQDYFSPQALAYLIFLSILALAVTFLPKRRPALHLNRWPLTRRPARLTLAPEGSRVERTARGAALLLAVVGFTALAMAHQLTPVVLIVDVAALVLVRRFSAPLLPVAFAAVLIAWVSYGATDFWVGHLGDLLGGGSVSASVQANVTGRVQGSTEHLVVVGVRLLFAVVLWSAAAAGAWRALRHSTGLPLWPAVLAAAPFPLVALQPYGGEAQLRLYLFTVPFMLCLGARLLVPGYDFGRRAVAALAVVGVVTVPVFYVARYGNEQFEQVRPGEVQAVSQMYRLAPAGATLVALNANLPWRYERFTDYTYVTAEAEDLPVTLDALLSLMRPSAPGSYLLVTRGQLAYATASRGLPPDRGDRLAQQLRASPRFDLVFSNEDAALYRFVPGGP